MDRATITVYEARAREWRDRRKQVAPERARDLGARVRDGVPRVDLGCGPGKYLRELGAPVVALDAAAAMLELAREVAPEAWLVRGELAALPFRRGALGGAWARKSYLHLPRTELPAALADLHRALEVGAPAALDFRVGDHEGPLTGDDFPGRFFAEWRPEPLVDVLVGAGFTIDDVEVDDRGGDSIRVRTTRAHTLPDYVAADMRLLVCGLNPSLYAADRGVGYARPGNRFWPAARSAGLVTRDRDPRHALRHHRIGMTDLVKRATTGAAELRRDEYAAGATRVEQLVRWLRPRAVCFVGLTGWRVAVDRNAVVGEQADGFGGVAAYVMPNTSGINAHATLDDLTAHLRAAAALADRVS